MNATVNKTVNAAKRWDTIADKKLTTTADKAINTNKK